MCYKLSIFGIKARTFFSSKRRQLSKLRLQSSEPRPTLSRNISVTPECLITQVTNIGKQIIATKDFIADKFFYVLMLEMGAGIAKSA